VSPVGCLKIDMACFFRTVSISDELVSVLMDTISVVFGLKLSHEWKRGGVWYGIVVLEV
jgi:hypothetical protein